MEIKKTWLITPPFTQVNTPYPATCYLKGFLNELQVETYQSDLSLEVFLRIFSSEGLKRAFNEVEKNDPDLSDNAFRIWSLQHQYESTVDQVISFLQNQRSTLAYQLATEGYLPQAGRFDRMADPEYMFGHLSIIDKAKYLCTLYLEDLSDFIKESLDPHFGFSRYAEKLSSAVSDFSVLEGQLQIRPFFTMQILEEIIREKIALNNPDLVAITIPFPGNLFSALKIGQFLKTLNPEIKIVAGGGYCNTELRSVFDTRVFNYFDFIILDDGEKPIQLLLQYLNGERERQDLKRTFILDKGHVRFFNNAEIKDIPQRESGTPDYGDLFLDKYVSILEILNPMHRLWSDGRWNKLTMAHGCYWGKCTFCDVTLDYIARYQPLTAQMLCDRIERIIKQTNETGFHFVDEAAPPALMRDLAIELIRRDLRISWWTNIRFEKAFSADLCRLLAKSGCIAVSGGLEVASDRLLALIKKGVTVGQVSRVAKSLRDAGILVHAYLMYGFPTQTEQETIDALEIVRQLFKFQNIQSGFWHRFSMTAHSPVGQDPSHFGVVRTGPEFKGFAENDLEHLDPEGASHVKFGEGLRHSLYNYMNDLGIEEDLATWFPFSTPRTTIKKNYISTLLNEKTSNKLSDQAKVLWIGGEPVNKRILKNEVYLELASNKGKTSILMTPEEADWFLEIFGHLILSEPIMNLQQLKESYEGSVGEFEAFINSRLYNNLREEGLIMV